MSSKWSLSSGFPTKTLYELVLSRILPCSLRARCLFQYPIVEHPQHMFLPRCERPSFTPVNNTRQNYSSMHFNLYIFGYQAGRQKVLHGMIASTP